MQMLALKVIDRGEVKSQAALAERLLVEDGLLKRCAGEDRRCVRLEVTKEGRREVASLHTELERLESELRKHLTAQEMKTLRQLLEKLHAGLMQTGDASSESEDERAH
jgi:MarR family transcriptional regulator, transcriptional regulator for hemolysin